MCKRQVDSHARLEPSFGRNSWQAEVSGGLHKRGRGALPCWAARRKKLPFLPSIIVWRLRELKSLVDQREQRESRLLKEEVALPMNRCIRKSVTPPWPKVPLFSDLRWFPACLAFPLAFMTVPSTRRTAGCISDKMLSDQMSFGRLLVCVRRCTGCTGCCLHRNMLSHIGPPGDRLSDAPDWHFLLGWHATPSKARSISCVKLE